MSKSKYIANNEKIVRINTLHNNEEYEEEDEEPLEDCGEDLDMALSCTCGAWKVVRGEQIIHVADCICGNGR